jgi:hypothetical protein
MPIKSRTWQLEVSIRVMEKGRTLAALLPLTCSSSNPTSCCLISSSLFPFLNFSITPFAFASWPSSSLSVAHSPSSSLSTSRIF